MAKRFKGNSQTIAKILRERIKNKLERYQPNDKDVKATLLRASLLVEAQAVLNIRRKLNKNSFGPLRESIGHRFTRKGLLVGSFGIPYARIHEFGFTGLQQVKAHTRNQTIAFGRPLTEAKQVQVREHSRYMRVPARPYLGPAMQDNRQKIIDLFTKLIGERLGSN